MLPLQVSADEFRSLAERVSALPTDFLAGLDNRQTVSATSAIDTAAFDLPLPEKGLGEAILRNLEALTEHVRAPTGAARYAALVEERPRFQGLSQ